MWKLAETLPKPVLTPPSADCWPDQDRPLGLEFEFENVRLEQIQQDLEYDVWDPHADGSLMRGGVEFALRQPIQARYVNAIIVDLLNAAKKHEADPSYRCGMHVHIQVSDLTSIELLRLFLLYALFEPSIFEWVGLYRAKTRFCKPWWEANAHVRNLCKSLAAPTLKSAKLKQVPDTMRYSALNVHAMWKYGTVEFRHLESTLSPERALNWLKIITALVYKAQDKSLQIAELLDRVDKTSEEAFYREVFGHAADLMPRLPLNRDAYTVLQTAINIKKDEAQSLDNISWDDLAGGNAEAEYVKLFVERHSKPKRKKARKKSKQE